jgi:chitinase
LFATFDDKRSIAEKAKFVRNKRLGGIMFWELTGDEPKGGLVEAIWEALRN